jgi:hypothetical protein
MCASCRYRCSPAAGVWIPRSAPVRRVQAFGGRTQTASPRTCANPILSAFSGGPSAQPVGVPEPQTTVLVGVATALLILSTALSACRKVRLVLLVPGADGANKGYVTRSGPALDDLERSERLHHRRRNRDRADGLERLVSECGRKGMYSTGGAAPAMITERETNEFDDAVRAVLLDRGFELDAPVGASQYRVDLAVRDRRETRQDCRPTSRYLSGDEHSSGVAYDSPTQPTNHGWLMLLAYREFKCFARCPLEPTSFLQVIDIEGKSRCYSSAHSPIQRELMRLFRAGLHTTVWTVGLDGPRWSVPHIRAPRAQITPFCEPFVCQNGLRRVTTRAPYRDRRTLKLGNVHSPSLITDSTGSLFTNAPHRQDAITDRHLGC